MADTDTPVTPSPVTPEPSAPVTPEPVAQPIPEEAPAEEEKMIFELDVYLPLAKETVTIKKLFAGTYYKAQQLSLMYLRSIADMEMVKGKALKGAVDSEGNPDLSKLESRLKEETPSFSREQADKIMASMEESENIKFELLQLCLGRKDVGEKYYAEDVALLLNGVIEVNGFWKNLKKSVRHTNTGSQTK